jgi:hypothetical protein
MSDSWLDAASELGEDAPARTEQGVELCWWNRAGGNGCKLGPE